MTRVVDLQPSRVHNLGVFNLKVATADHAASDDVVSDVEIFKAGSFKDSMGDERTWTVEQLAMMASNFELLRSSDRFPNVPLRRDHSWSIEGVIGYIDGLRVNGSKLIADLEFTEPEDLAKFQRGTYRSRSVEIGAYEDNDGVTYWPVVMGLAFVDIPAVEGLHRAANRQVASYSLQKISKEPAVPDPVPETFKFTLGGVETADYAAVAAHMKKIEADNSTLTARNTQLETFAAEQTKANRHNFVTALAESRKVAATQVDGLKALVESLTDEQWEAFKTSYEHAPAQTLLSNHADGVSNPQGETNPDPVAEERELLEETVAMHRRAGLSDEAIARTPTHKRLLALKGA